MAHNKNLNLQEMPMTSLAKDTRLHIQSKGLGSFDFIRLLAEKHHDFEYEKWSIFAVDRRKPHFFP